MDRSYLFVPGDRNERFEKAWATAADQIIVDLEDAVAPQSKSLARERVRQWLDVSRPVIVRINAADTEWYSEDIELARHPGVYGLMVPKAETLSPALVQLCKDHDTVLLPQIETAVGIRELDRIAGTPKVQRLSFGSLDFQVDLGIVGERDALLYFRSQMVLASRLAQLQAPIDGVTVDINNDDALRADADYGRQLGFGAKLCIHPRQVDGVNAVFSPSESDLAWAQRVSQAIAESGGAAVAVDGKMVDRPVILKAQRILASRERKGRKR